MVECQINLLSLTNLVIKSSVQTLIDPLQVFMSVIDLQVLAEIEKERIKEVIITIDSSTKD